MNDYKMFALVRCDKTIPGDDEWELVFHHNDAPVIAEQKEAIEEIGASWGEHLDGDTYEYKAVPAFVILELDKP